MNNYAFIDAQNVHLGIKSLGWDLDWGKFRVYLREKYNISTAYIFYRFYPNQSGFIFRASKSGVCFDI